MKKESYLPTEELNATAKENAAKNYNVTNDPITINQQQPQVRENTFSKTTTYQLLPMHEGPLWWQANSLEAKREALRQSQFDKSYSPIEITNDDYHNESDDTLNASNTRQDIYHKSNDYTQNNSNMGNVLNVGG